jgi:hypothetical protein
MTNTMHHQEETASSSIDTSAADTEAASIDKGAATTITILPNHITSLSIQLEREKIKNMEFLQINEDISKELSLKKKELE